MVELVECYRCGHLVDSRRPHIEKGGKCFPNWGRFCNSGQSILLGGDYEEKHQQKRTYCRAPPYGGYNPVGYCEVHLATYLQLGGSSMNAIRGLEPRPIVPLRRCAFGCGGGGCALSGKKVPPQNPYNPNWKSCWLMVGCEYTQRWEREHANEVAELRTLNGIKAPSGPSGLVKPPSDLANFGTSTRRSA